MLPKEALLDKFLSGRLSEADQEDFVRLLKSDPGFKRMVQASVVVEEYSDRKNKIELHLGEEPKIAKRSALARPIVQYGMIMTNLITLALLVIVWLQSGRLEPSNNSLDSTKGVTVHLIRPEWDSLRIKIHALRSASGTLTVVQSMLTG